MTSVLTSSVSEKEASARLERFFQAAECTTQVELAAFLGIRQSSIADAKRRKAIPADWLLTLLCKKYINPRWILTGEGPTHLHPYEDGVPVALPVQTIVERRPPQGCSMDELVKEIVRRAMNESGNKSHTSVLKRSRRPFLRRRSPVRRTVRL